MAGKLKGIGVGAGYFSDFHYDAWTRLDEVEIVAICDPDTEKAKAMAAKYGIANVCDDYLAAIDKHKPDFVDVITRPDTHLEICTAIAKTSTPIICQKPLAPTVEDAVKIVQVVKQAGVPMMVHENFRFQPWYREMRRLWEQGVVGDRIHTVSFKNRAGDGWGDDAYMARQPYFQTMPKFLIFEAGIHTIDSFRFLAGDISRVWCKLRKLNPVIAGEDTGIAVFEFASGALGHYDANRFNESTAKNPRYTFGEIALEANGGTIRVYDDGRLAIQPLGKPEQFHQYEHPSNGFAGDCVYATQKHFVTQLRSGSEFETSGTEYLKNIALQEAMYRSSESGQWEAPEEL